jgi:hypothetical protein
VGGVTVGGARSSEPAGAAGRSRDHGRPRRRPIHADFPTGGLASAPDLLIGLPGPSQPASRWCRQCGSCASTRRPCVGVGASPTGELSVDPSRTRAGPSASCAPACLPGRSGYVPDGPGAWADGAVDATEALRRAPDDMTADGQHTQPEAIRPDHLRHDRPEPVAILDPVALSVLVRTRKVLIRVVPASSVMVTMNSTRRAVIAPPGRDTRPPARERRPGTRPR